MVDFKQEFPVELPIFARPKIEKFLFPNSAERRVFLTQKTRRSVIPRPIFACVHGFGTLCEDEIKLTLLPKSERYKGEFFIVIRDLFLNVLA